MPLEPHPKIHCQNRACMAWVIPVVTPSLVQCPRCMWTAPRKFYAKSRGSSMAEPVPHKHMGEGSIPSPATIEKHV